MKIRKILLVFLLIIGGGAGYLTYTRYYHSKSEVIILKAKYEEFKKKPQDAGGIVIANANSLIYEQLKSGNNSKISHHILPEPEAPINIIYDQIKGDKVFSSIDEILENIGFYNEQDKADVAAGELRDDTSVMTDSITQDQKHEGGDRDDFREDKAGNIDVTAASEEQGGYNTKLNIIKAPESAKKLDQIKISNKDQEGGYKLQLTTAFSEAEARKEWENIKQKYAKILHDADLVLRKVEGKNDRIFYLVMAGTYNSLGQAKLVCSKLSSKHQNCIITK